MHAHAPPEIFWSSSCKHPSFHPHTFLKAENCLVASGAFFIVAARFKWSGTERFGGQGAHFCELKLFQKFPVVIATGSCEPGRDLPSSVRSCSELGINPMAISGFIFV